MDGRIEFEEHRALKIDGAYGHRIRSRLVCDNGLILQNSNTIAENMELARELVPSWSDQSPQEHNVVRRYDLEPLHIRDVETGWHTARTDALGPSSVHDLFLQRIDQLGNLDKPTE